MLRSRKTRTVLCIAALILCLAAGGAAVARADGFATYGTAQSDTSFYVSATGPASVTLTQSGMGLVEKQYIYNTANTATEYAYAQYTVLYKGAQDAYWRQGPGWTGASCTLTFPSADVYLVRVLPLAVSNMQSSQAAWRYSRWITVPAWYVSGVRNCGVYSNYPYAQPVYVTPTPRPTATPVPYVYSMAPVTLNFWDESGVFLGAEVQYMAPGTHSVQTTRTFSHYLLVSKSAETVYVNSRGAANPSVVNLFYRYYSPATPKPQPATGRREVKPYKWDTQYKEGTSAKNPTRGKLLPNLDDDNKDTTFQWTVWRSEWKDSVPEFTAYFNGETVGAVAFRNGDASSAKNFAKHARAIQWRVRVWNRYGQYQDIVVNLSSNYSADYQVKSLGKKFTDVERVELFLVKYKTGSATPNGIYISDIKFMTE